MNPGNPASPPIPAWIAVEGLAGLTQFAIFGILLGLIHGARNEATGKVCGLSPVSD